MLPSWRRRRRPLAVRRLAQKLPGKQALEALDRQRLAVGQLVPGKYKAKLNALFE